MRNARRRYPWKVFLFLWLAGTLSSPLAVPYFLGLSRVAPIPVAGMPDSTAMFAEVVPPRVQVVPPPVGGWLA